MIIEQVIMSMRLIMLKRLNAYDGDISSRVVMTVIQSEKKTRLPASSLQSFINQ